jgi:pimeloyl-ACP methyl ester carboxylesterase
MARSERDRTIQILGEKIGCDMDEIDSRKLIRKSSKPFLLVHGRLDDDVPVSHALATYEARTQGTKLVIYEGEEHGTYYFQRFEDFQVLCLDWFAAHLLQDDQAYVQYGMDT